MKESDRKKSGRLRQLFRGRPDQERDCPEKVPQAQPEQEEPEPEQPQTEIHVLEGALYNVWRAWRGELSPPVLSLNGPDARPLPLDEQALLRERVRLTAQLEQDAQKRLRALEEAAARGVGLKADCRCYVSNDGMVAWLFLFPPSASELKLQFDCIAEAMQAGNINAGIDSTAVTALFEQRRYFELTPFALGTPPVQGKNGQIIELYPREVTPEVKLMDDGTADYRAVNYVQRIQKGDAICEIVPPVEGKAGMRVDGVPVEPRPVKAARIPAGSNTTVSEDGLHLLASRDGHLEYTGTNFQVKPVLEIAGDVDYSTGNIDFLGDVHICGDVRENFTVHATGTVTVDGLVEAACVDAGGDILISCGVLGDNRALLKSRGNIRARYMESCVAYAGKCVYTDCIIGSQIYADDMIEVTTGRGTIIGGTLTAARAVKARMIGSQAGRTTEIRLGEYPYIQEQLRNSEADLKAIYQEMEELQKELFYLQMQQGMEGATERLAKNQLRRSVLAMKEEQITKRRAKTESMVPELSKCRLECGIVYPVTMLIVQQAVRRFDSVKHHCIAAYDIDVGEIKIM